MIVPRKLRRLAGWITVCILVGVMVVSWGVPRTLLPVDDALILRTMWDEEQYLRQIIWRAQGPLEADDPALLRILRERYLDPPSPGPMDLMLDRTDPTAQRYNLYRRGFKSWMRTNKLLRRLFSDVPSGFFLEAGALDGEFISNTLYLERELGWTGILVEADSTLYAAIAGKRRKVWVSHSCVSPASYAQKMTFEGYHAEAHASIEQRLLVRSTGNLAGVMSPAGGQMGTKVEEKIQCFPLFSYLLALNATSLHYISLDVEGAECDILLSLPWKRVNVSVLSIEHRDQNTCFREYYEMPFGSMAVTPQREENGKAVDSAVPHKTQQSKDQGPTIPHTAQQDVVVQTRVVYTNQHDPASGKDDYFVRFMKERGYVLYDYWDGDYTYIKMNSSVCERHCGESLPAGVELGSRG